MDPSSRYYDRIQSVKSQSFDSYQRSYSPTNRHLLFTHQQLRDAAAVHSYSQAMPSPFGLSTTKNSFPSHTPLQETPLSSSSSSSSSSLLMTSSASIFSDFDRVSSSFQPTTSSTSGYHPSTVSASSAAKLLLSNVNPTSALASSPALGVVRHAVELKSGQPVFPGQPPLLRSESEKNLYPPQRQIQSHPYQQPPPRQSSQTPSRILTSFPGQHFPPKFRHAYHVSPTSSTSLSTFSSSSSSSPSISHSPPQYLHNNDHLRASTFVPSSQSYYQNPSPLDYQRNYDLKRSFYTPRPTSAHQASKLSPSSPLTSSSRNHPSSKERQHQSHESIRSAVDIAEHLLVEDASSIINYGDLDYTATSISATAVTTSTAVSGTTTSTRTNDKAWMNKANELLTLSNNDDTTDILGHYQRIPSTLTASSTSNDTITTDSIGETGGFIPQIVLNPWDPHQAPVMSLAPLANAMQAYQQIMAASVQNDDEGKKQRVLCISPDDEMGFLLNLPPPCNVILSPSTVGLSGKIPDSPFQIAFLNFIKGLSNTTTTAVHVTTTVISQILPGKKAYTPPYTPKKIHTTADPVSSTQAISVRKSNPVKPIVNNNNNSSVKSIAYHKNKRKFCINSSDDITPIAPKRETSRRKAKEKSTSKLLFQMNDDDDIHPDLDLSDSDDDATWTPFNNKNGGLSLSTSISKRDSYESNDYYNDIEVVKSKKQRFNEESTLIALNLPPPTQLVRDGHHYKEGDFLVLKTEAKRLSAPLFRLDSKTLLQRFNPEQIESGEWLYRSANLFSTFNPTISNEKYISVAVKYIRNSPSDIVVKVIKRASVITDPTLRRRSMAETSQFQENFEVYIQALISQSLDDNFLNEVFAEKDEYFVSNIEKVDSVILLRKEKVMTGVKWSIRFRNGINTWPCLNDLGSVAVQDTKCEACDIQKSRTMIQMYGQPYNPNTLQPVPPNEQARMNRNFSVCLSCARIASLYHRLHHRKHKLFQICSEIVEKRKKESPNNNTTLILNKLLENDVWLEEQFQKMQELWADADGFIR